MITQTDKKYLAQLKIDNPEVYEFIQHVLDDYRLDTRLGCHDIANIVSLIYGNFQLMELTTPGLTDNPCWAQMSEDMRLLVNSMKSVSYYRYAHHIKPTKEKLETFISEKLMPLINSDNYSHLHIQTNICLEQIEINVDMSKLVFAIKGILDNIAEYDCKVNVNVSVYSKADMLFIDITDDCSIIAAETLSKLFQPFNTNKSTHIGLSLSSAYQIVMAHGGDIVFSPIGDKGYNYIISIPL